ncbi:MAG: SRPBCC family protein [Dermatophilaceae bacterium]
MTSDTTRVSTPASPTAASAVPEPPAGGYRTRMDLVGDTTLVLTREFRAPRTLVWAALTSPEHVRQWYGCQMGEVTTCDIDLRPGGRWHYVLTSPDGHEDSFSGEYRELDPPARLVTTEGYDNIPGAAYLSTVTLDEADGVTTFRNVLEYPATEVRDGHVGSGMEYGMNASLDALERLVVALAEAG